MFDVFGSVKSLMKLDSVCIDNNVFRLHYKGTVIILVAFSLLVTSRQYIGDPIDCIVDASIGGDIMDTYCWIHSTYTLPDKLDGKIGKESGFLFFSRFLACFLQTEHLQRYPVPNIPSNAKKSVFLQTKGNSLLCKKLLNTYAIIIIAYTTAHAYFLAYFQPISLPHSVTVPFIFFLKCPLFCLFSLNRS